MSRIYMPRENYTKWNENEIKVSMSHLITWGGVFVKYGSSWCVGSMYVGSQFSNDSRIARFSSLDHFYPSYEWINGTMVHFTSWYTCEYGSNQTWLSSRTYPSTNLIGYTWVILQWGCMAVYIGDVWMHDKGMEPIYLCVVSLVRCGTKVLPNREFTRLRLCKISCYSFLTFL